MTKIQIPPNHPLLTNHVVLNQGIFPAVGYFEIALDALLQQVPAAVAEFPIKITDALWCHPLHAQADIDIIVKPNKSGYGYRVQTTPESPMVENQAHDGNARLHAAGNFSSVKPDQAHKAKNLDIKDITQRLTPAMDRVAIYQVFANRGIHYKKLFKSLESFQCRGKEALGRINPHPADDNYRLKPGILDNAIQCALLNLDQFQDSSRLFVPFSLQEIIIWQPLSAPCYVKTTLTDGDETKNFFRFNLVLTDQHGTCLMEMKDLCVKAYVQEQPKQWAIAATFTVEPLETPLAFWIKQLQWKHTIDFAPYNQVFQALLSAQSLLSQNQAGVNSILFRLEDLASHTRSHLAIASPGEKEKRLSDCKRFVLPNELEIAHLHRYETEYLYEEIFVEKTYAKHGIELKDGACVLDIGANIGLFALFITEKCKGAKVYSFEPSPVTFDILKKNLALYCPNAVPCNFGIADSDREAEFTFYPHSTVFSGFHADAQQDGTSLKQAMENEILARNKGQDPKQVAAHVDLMMKDRLRKENYTCQLRSLSSFLEEYQLEQIDLLKVDAEKCEWEILSSIEDKEWQKIRQIVVEVHDNEGPVLHKVKALLQEKGFHVAMEEETLLQKSGLYNLYGTRPDEQQGIVLSTMEQEIQTNLDELLNLLAHCHANMPVPLLLGLCPSTPEIRAQLSDIFMQRMQTRIDQAMRALPKISLIQFSDRGTDQDTDLAAPSLSASNATSDSVDYYDAVRDKMGNIPYTPRFFASMATSLARRLHAIQRTDYKCIALDCDNTLWSGIVGEQGPQGIQIPSEFQMLHQFMLAQKDQGMLLCLVSKNNVDAVKQVFLTRKDMRLEWQDLSAWKINWASKSTNLQALSEEMNLGLDSFIFLDDSPVECAEVRANCPAVLTLQLPEKKEDIAEFLQHIWAFDHVNAMTGEDAQRTILYQQNAQREQLRTTALTFNDFIAGLELEIDISEAQSQDYPRCAQLTQRTNQFNFLKNNLTLAEIEALLDPQAAQKIICHAVRVRDRFGDYGLCGLIMYAIADTSAETSIDVNTFLLSCRALGRGVEHKMMAFLGEQAQAKNISRVKVPFLTTSKNKPAGQFLQDIGSAFPPTLSLDTSFTAPGQEPNQQTAPAVYLFPSNVLKELVFNPVDLDAKEQKVNHARTVETTPISKRETSPAHENHSTLMQRLGNEHSCIKSLMNTMDNKPAAASIPKQAQKQTPRQNHNPEQHRQDVEDIVLENLSQVLNIEPAHLSLSEPFSDFGLDSMANIDLVVKLNDTFGITLPTTTLFDYACVNDLTRHLCEHYSQAVQARLTPSAGLSLETIVPEQNNAQENISHQAPKSIANEYPMLDAGATTPDTRHHTTATIPNNHHKKHGIAVVGMSGRFPGADNIDEFWQLLAAGKSGISEAPPERWDVASHYDPDRQKPNKTYSKWGGFLANIDQFDAAFFKISNREAEQIDPQQRIFLEESWHALEHAGYLDMERDDKQWGVFVGTDGGDYQTVLQDAAVPIEAPAFMGNHASILAARIAYLLNFKGAALAIDTACSSSLVAVHYACESLLKGDLELALAGGVSIRCGANFHILSSKAGMLAADAECKVFDARADGFVPGEAVGIVVLKRIDDAVRDHDSIYGVIKGSAINQDGKTNGITAPSGLSQTELALKVYRQYDINPGDIGFIEAHGTGTPLGDPIEVNALSDAFRAYTDKKLFCAIGSAKTNIGHCTHAAGISGLIKLLLCLHHKKWVANVNFTHPNPHIAFADSPFFVSTQYCDWPVENNQARMGAVSSFGFSGTNAHMVVSEAPKQTQPQQLAKPSYLITLSAKTSTALKQLGRNLVNQVAANRLTQEQQAYTLANIAYTLSVGRAHFGHRWAMVVSSTTELSEALQKIDRGEQSRVLLANEKLGNEKSVNEILTNDNHTISNADQAIYKQVLNQVTAELKAIDPHQQTEQYRDLLMALGGLYVKGYISDTREMHNGQDLQRISLPTYPFSKTRYWATNRTTGHQRATVARTLVRTEVQTEVQTHAQRITRLAENPALTTKSRGKPNNIPLAALVTITPGLSAAERKITAANVAARTIETQTLETDNCTVVSRLEDNAQGVELHNKGNGISLIQISTPKSQNTLSTSTIEALSRTLAALRNANQTKVLIVSGLDATFLAGGRNEQNAVVSQKLHIDIASLPFITIAAMKGDALGAGFLMGALCDFMICSLEHHYAFTHITQNIFPTEQEDAFFNERFGHARAQAFLYAAQPFSGQQLLQQGWNCTLLSNDQIDATVHELATALAETPRQSLSLLKQHLSKRLLTYVQRLTIAPLTALGKASADKHKHALPLKQHGDITGPITSSSPFVKLQSHADNVLLVNILPAAKPGDANQGKHCESLLLALEAVFAQINHSEQYAAVVFASDYPGFLPLENADQSLVHRFQTLFLHAKVPVVAAFGNLGHNTDNNTDHNTDHKLKVHDQAWLLALFCDAVVYDENGVYCYGEVIKNHQLSKAANVIFSHRFGHYLAQEILMTGGQYSGKALQQRNQTLHVTSAHKVLSQALHIAQSWSVFPAESLLQWKRHASSTIENMLALSSEWTTPTSTVTETNVPASTTPHVVFSTPVIDATLHPHGVLVVTMQDREAKNMFSDAFIQGLTDVFEHIEQASNYKVVILTGYDTYFSAGGTQEGLKAIQEGTIKYSDAPIFQLPMLCKLPVIAAMQGHGIGGGWALGMFADFILFSEESVYSCNFMRFGFTPGAGSTLMFPHQLGMDLSKEALLTAREYKGKALLNKGLSMPVLPRKHLNTAAMALAQQLAQIPYPVLLMLKQQFATSLRQQLAETYQLELAMHAKTFVNNSKTLKKIQQNFHQGTDALTTAPNPSVALANPTPPAKTPTALPDLPAIQTTLKTLLAEELYMPEEEIQEQVQFVDLGLDSITGVTWIQKINRTYNTKLSATKVYTYPTLVEMSQHVMHEIADGAAHSQHEPLASQYESSASQQPPSAKNILSTTAPNANAGTATPAAPQLLLPSVLATLKQLLAEELYMAADDIEETAQFVDIGLDSITGVTWIQKINQAYGTSMNATKVYTYPTLVHMSHYIVENTPGQQFAPTTTPKPVNDSQPADEKKVPPAQNPETVAGKSMQTPSASTTQGIAVIGMAGKFPQAETVEQYWENIISGKDCIVEIPKTRWDIERYYEEHATGPQRTNCKWIGAVEGVDLFDPMFFEISAEEACAMDPQQRLFLETCWHSIEDAGYNPGSLSGSNCGVFSGCVTNDYAQLSPESGLTGHGLMGSATSVLAARISYFLNLQGPCLSIDTACSSSLVAIANACDSLTAGSCDLALAGGVHIMAGPAMHIMTGQAGMLSPEGRCFAFDQRANGFVPAESVGVILLKPLAQAQQDQDPIYGVIQGWGVNQDGRTNGLNAPNPQSQTRLQQRVYQQFNINPADIQVVEAHGTGTKLGDPIEIEALCDAFKPYTQQPAYCALGSVKSNIGHTLTAAGVSGVIKLLLALKHKIIPPTIHFKQLNEHINLTGSPFYINTSARPWNPSTQGTRQAAINAFGLNGTNAHLVIAEAATREVPKLQKRPANSPTLFPLSAKTAAQLRLYAQGILSFLDTAFLNPSPVLTLDNMVYTFQVGRQAMNHRLAIICDSIDALEQTLQHYLQGQFDARLFVRAAKKSVDETAHTGKVETLDEQSQQNPNYPALAEYWVNGGVLDWRRFNPSKSLQRISGLPQYPFARERYWAASSADDHTLPNDHTSQEKSIASAPAVKPSETENNVQRFLQTLVAEQLQQPLHAIPLDKQFSGLGINSLHIIKLTHQIKSLVGNDFSPTQFFKHSNIADLAAYLIAHYPLAVNRLIVKNPTPENQTADERPLEYNEATPRLENTPTIIPNRADRYQPFPLTDIQESFFTGRKLPSVDGNKVGCHIYLEMEFDNHDSRGPLDIYRLNTAWKQLVEHHDMLRAVILSSGQQQILTEVPPYKFKVHDLRRQSTDVCETSRQQLRTSMSHQVYQANHWPLFDIQISTCPNKRIVHVSIDELILDAFSLELLCYQWKKRYLTPDWALPGLELSFRDYVLANKKFEGSTPYQQDLQYWLARLNQMPSGPKLPLSTSPKTNTTPNIHADNTANTRIRLEGGLEKRQWQILKNKLEELNVSPTVLLLKVFTDVLRSYSETNTFSLILTFFNRLQHPQVDQVLAPFISTNVFVVEECAEDKSAADAGIINENQQLQQMQTRLFEDLGHNSVSGIRVLRELKKRSDIPNTLSLPVVFTSLLGHQQWDGEESFLDDVRYSISQTPQVMLDHQIHEKNAALKFNWDVSPNHYAPGVIEKIFADYCNALNRLADAPQMQGFHEQEAFSGQEALGQLRAFSKQGAISGKEALSEKRTEPYPLSDQQQAYAFGRSRHGAQLSSQVYTYFEVENLDHTRLNNAWQKMLDVHDILATVIHPNGTQQRLSHVPAYTIQVDDLRAQTAINIEQALKKTETEIMSRLCPLGEWPYFNLRVSQINDRISGVHFSLDLMIADGPSIELLQKDLFYFYANPEAPATGTEITYRDYILCLQQYQQTESYQRSLQYWKNKFIDMPPGPSLPKLNGAASQQTERLEGTLSQWPKIKTLAKKLQVSPSMILFTVYAEVLAAWADATAFSIVIPSWERLPLHPDIDQVAGDFTAMSWVVIEKPNTAEPALTFEKKVRHYHRIVQQDLSHRAVSGLRALRTVITKTKRSNGKKQTMLTFPIVYTDLSAPVDLNLPKGVQRIKSLSQTPQVHLDNISTEQDEQLYLHWDLAKGVFPDGMMQEIFSAYQRILEYLAEVPYSWKETSFDHLIHAQPEKYKAQIMGFEKQIVETQSTEKRMTENQSTANQSTENQSTEKQTAKKQIVSPLASDSVQQA